MYRQGLGDCFLLTFNTGAAPVHMLVDCGTLGANLTDVTMKDVAKDIFDETRGGAPRGHLDLLVVTHEHKDHLSGFNSQRAVFDKIDVDRVWAAWTEDPDDQDAIDLEKFEEDLMEAVALAAPVLIDNDAPDGGERQALREVGQGARALLQFRGDLPDGNAPLGADFAKTVHAAMSYASTKAGGLPEFREPGEVIQPPWLPGVRFYVLGPPRKKTALTNLGTHSSPELYHFTSQLSTALSASLAFRGSDLSYVPYRDALDAAKRQAFESTLPFDAQFRVELDDADARKKYLAAYDDDEFAWRRVDHDWLAGAEDLALQLDNVTNNTSLALAVELIADGRVILLAADAQLGNWLSWDALTFSVPQPDGSVKIVKSEDLLRRTVLYKVGHHSSHNATINDRGLELMERDDLVAIIPVDADVAANKEWTMPAEGLYERLIVKAGGRVIRSDIGWPAEKPDGLTNQEWTDIQADPNIIVGTVSVDVLIQ
jgi:hypothetical protein